jgi:hypothetical protein
LLVYSINKSINQSVNNTSSPYCKPSLTRPPDPNRQCLLGLPPADGVISIQIIMESDLLFEKRRYQLFLPMITDLGDVAMSISYRMRAGRF